VVTGWQQQPLLQPLLPLQQQTILHARARDQEDSVAVH
jgi:hypothetical protein